MESILCCLICVVCFWCGVCASNGLRLPRRRSKPTEQLRAVSREDALSRDIAAMLAYTIPGREKDDETNETHS